MRVTTVSLSQTPTVWRQVASTRWPGVQPSLQSSIVTANKNKKKENNQHNHSVATDLFIFIYKEVTILFLL